MSFINLSKLMLFGYDGELRNNSRLWLCYLFNVTLGILHIKNNHFANMQQERLKKTIHINRKFMFVSIATYHQKSISLK